MLNVYGRVMSAIDKKAAGILIKKPSNIFYITRFSGEGYVYVSNNGEISLYVDGRYTERAKKECVKDIRIIGIREVYNDIAGDICGIIFNDKFTDRAVKPGNADVCNNKPTIVFESDYFTYEEFLGFRAGFKRRVKLVPSHNAISKIRSLKDKEELSLIIEAVSIAEKFMIDSLRVLLGFDVPDIKTNLSCKTVDSGVSLKSVKSERDLALIYKKSLMDSYSKESFETIVLSGSNSSLPHGIPSDVEINKSGILLCDFGAEQNGYKSDETITIHLGNPDSKFLDVYDTVYSAQQLAVSKIKPGVKFSYLDRTARDYIEKRGYGKYFTHSLGHGVGLDIHEYPYVSKRNDDIVREGMVFTVEPGVYIEGEFGVRIEDMCFVEKDGARFITNINKSQCRLIDMGII